MEPVYPPLRVEILIETHTLRIAVLEVQIAGCQALLLTHSPRGDTRGVVGDRLTETAGALARLWPDSPGNSALTPCERWRRSRRIHAHRELHA